MIAAKLDRPISNLFSRLQHVRLRSLILQALAILAVLISTFLPRFLSLERPVTQDELLWLGRSKDFYTALERKDFAATFRTGHPGVTTMWMGVGGFWTKYQDYLEHYTKRKPPSFSDYVDKMVEANPLYNLVWARLWMVVLQTLTLGLAYWFAQRLVGPIPALIGFLLIAFDPFHISLTRLLHLDGLMSNLILLSVLAYVSYLREHKGWYLIVCGISAGLSWLTKSPGFFVLPIFGLLALIDLWQSLRRTSQASWIKKMIACAWPVAVLVVIAGVVFVAAWPAMWVNPLNTLHNVFGMAEDYAVEGHENAVFFNGYIAENGELGARFWYFYPLTYLWRTTPVVLIGLLLAIWAILTHRKLFTEPGVRWTLAGILITVAIFTLGMSLSLKKFDRYFLPVYAPLDILAGLGWVALADWVRTRLPASIAQIGMAVLLSLAVGIQAASAMAIAPYYFSYYNPLLGGGQKATQVLQVGWGEGLDLAADYLNKKDNSQNIHAASWYFAGPFGYYFNGTVVDIPTRTLSSEELQAILTTDYLVIYVHQWQRDLPQNLLASIANWVPEHSIRINGIEYVRIYKNPK